MKRVQKLIIGTAYVQAASLVAHAAANPGEVGIYNHETGAPAVAGDDSIVVAVNCVDSDGRALVEQSLPIPIRAISSRRNVESAVSAPKVVQVDFSAIAAVIEGDQYEVFVTDYNDYNYIIGRKRIAYEVTAADVLAADPSDAIKDGLIAAINADVSMPNILASSAGVDLMDVTGIAVGGSGATNVINNFRADYEILFDLVLGSNMFGIAVATVTALPDQGCGTFREVRKLEEVSKGYKGHLNRVIFPSSVNIQYKSVAGTAYDLTSIEHKSDQYTETEGDVHFQIATTVAMDDADANAFGIAFALLV